MAIFFRLVDDKRVPKRWYLRGPFRAKEDLDARDYTEAVQRPDPGPLTVPLLRSGNAMDWTEGDYAMPVVSEKVARILRDLAPDDVQLFPVTVQGRREPYFIANAVHACVCVDEKRSVDVRRFTKDGIRPDLAGQYEVIGKLVIDPTRTGGHKLFRVKDWEVALIASEEIKDAFERAGVVGAHFTPVT
ncbi:MAG TPA: DUF1629 domain-containing protein [Myxococcaceae bacterium]|nr:DUF1629 domain-containing protein [Myxococcaceae bacterium]